MNCLRICLRKNTGVWGVLFLGLSLLLSACITPFPISKTQPPSNSPLERFDFTQPQMGLPFRLQFYAPDSETATVAANAAYERVRQLNQILSDYETDSELNQLSRTAGQNRDIRVSDDLWKVLAMAQRRAHESDGSFDISVGPLVTLWRKARREHQLPPLALINSGLGRVGFRHIILKPESQSVRLLIPHMHLDLGGIAKGYALDEALSILRRHGITRALVTGSGDMAIGDSPPGKSGWRIEIPPHDSQTNTPSSFIHLKNCGFATSGDTVQRLEINGIRYSHILNPKTGLGLTNHSAVWVVAKDGMTADSFSTMISVIGGFRSLELMAKHYPKVSYRILSHNKNCLEEYISPKFPQLQSH